MHCAILPILILVIILVALYLSKKLQMYVKLVYFVIASTLCASLPIPLMLLKPKDPKNALYPARGILFAMRLVGVRVTIKGEENIVKDTGSVVLINHQRMLDLLVLAKLWEKMDNCAVIAKKEILYIFPFGFAAWLWGTIYIDRVKRDEAQRAVNKTGKTIQLRKARVLLFPEGTRNTSNQLLPFKKGAFHLAQASGCPIQPVVVNRYRFIDDNKFDSGEIQIEILPAIQTTDFENLDDLITKTQEIMSKGVDSISNK